MTPAYRWLQGLLGVRTLVLALTLTGLADRVGGQTCLSGAFESQWIDCADNNGCSNQAEQRWCGSTLQTSTNKCSCFFYIVPCCGAQIQTRLPDPCGWECVGTNCQPPKGDLRLASTDTPQPVLRDRASGLPSWLAPATREQQP